MNKIAQGIKIVPQTDTYKGLQQIEVGGIVSALINLVLVVAAIVFFFMLVIGGIQWILSGGDKQATENARSRITAALIGLVIVFAAWAIGRILGTFFGIHIFDQFTLPSLG